MPRPTDIAEKATPESHAAGGRAKAAKARARREAAEKLAIEKLADELSPSIETLIEIRDSAETTPDRRQSAQYLIDRVLGRAMQRTELSGDVGLSVNIEDVRAKLDSLIERESSK